MSGAYDPVLEPLRGTVKTALNGKIADDDKNNNKYRYEGKEDDRPFFWREPLNDLQSAINELLVKRKKKLGATLSKAGNMAPFEDDDGPNISRPRSARGARRQTAQSGMDRSSRNSTPRSGPGSTRPGSGRLSGMDRSVHTGRPAQIIDRGFPQPESMRTGSRARELPHDDAALDDIDDEQLLEDDVDDYGGPVEDEGETSDMGQIDGEDPRVREARREQLQRAKEEFGAKCRELAHVRAALDSEDVLLKIRQAHSSELQVSITECAESAEQAHTWIKQLEELQKKRSAQLQAHDQKIGKAKKAIEETEAALQDLARERTAGEAKFTRDMASHTNTAKVENKTSSIWGELENDIRQTHKHTEEQAAERSREQMRMSKHLQELVIGEQELQKRLHAQRNAAAEIEAEGKELFKFWRREYLEEEMVVGGAVAEIEAEDRARSHLSGHGNRIRAKLEAATGNLNAQKAMIDDQAAMDETLKLKTDKIEADIRALQQKLDEAEERRASLDRQRDDIQQACQDKVEHLNSSLRAIETSANAVATEQVIAQRTLASSEEALETLEAGDTRARLEEDIEALRTSLVSIEARLHEVHKERSAVRETRARTQRQALEEAAKVTDKIDSEDALVQQLLAQRVGMEGEQRQLDGQRVVVHARVKQSKKSITPLVQEKKLYEAELEWVREFEEHSLMRMQEKNEAKQLLEVELADLKAQGSRQLKEQTDDEAIVEEGIRAMQELADTVCMHKAHVEEKLKLVQEALAQHEQDAASLAATMLALDGKITEADDQAAESEEKTLACKSDWENKDLDWKSRKKEWTTKQKKEERNLAGLQEARFVLQEEVDEVSRQLSQQRHAALNQKAMSLTIKGEKDMIDKLIANSQALMRRDDERELLLVQQQRKLKEALVKLKERYLHSRH